MRIVDLSHPVSPAMPLWPGTPEPSFSALSTIRRDGFGERWLQLSSHTGTHLDAPAHIIEGAATLDRLPVDCFIGKGVLLDLRSASFAETVSLEQLLVIRSKIEQADFLLLHSGWSRCWGRAEYNRDYPVLSPEAAAWLAGLGLKGVGIDAPSFDEAASEALPVHRVLLGAGLILIENLTGLEQLDGGDFLLSALPVPIVGAEACPVRAVGFISDFDTK
ncbi:MAG TPA: cyclase family protein [Chlorobaculum parvum]|uniref:Cyclase family protein n=1 Tax=Chlorobaculum parvum TaxID=274539 RepID=A0A7C5DDC1_9CHLB|nr:cyclase family protein [Chlorobaculum parvum]